MKNYILELFRPEIEAKMKEERAETFDNLFQIVQKLRKGESVEQIMKSGMDIETIKFAQRVLL